MSFGKLNLENVMKELEKHDQMIRRLTTMKQIVERELRATQVEEMNLRSMLLVIQEKKVQQAAADIQKKNAVKQEEEQVQSVVVKQEKLDLSFKIKTEPDDGESEQESDGSEDLCKLFSEHYKKTCGPLE